MFEQKTLDLEEARKIIEAMLDTATKTPGRPMSFAVVDNAGILVSFARMDGAAQLTARVSVNKAHTAIDTKRDTIAQQKRLKESGFDSTWFGDPRMALIPGGVLVKAGDGSILGAIGTSGRVASEDEVLARIGAAAINV